MLVLGVSDSHDAGVALLTPDTLLAAINEERLSRKKMAGGVPLRSLEAVFGVAGVAPSEVTHVAIAGRASLGAPPINNDFTDEFGRATGSQVIAEWIDRLPFGSKLLGSGAATEGYRLFMRAAATARIADIGRRLRGMGVAAPLRVYDHHDCHLASAYFTAGDDPCLVVSNDGFGDGLCCKIAVGRRGRLQVQSSTGFFHSLGVYYNFVTHYCGFPKSYHAGKTTGLAAFGNPERTRSVFEELIRWDERRGVYVNQGGLFRNLLREIHGRLSGVSPEDAAAGIQAHCEELVIRQLTHWTRHTGLNSVTLVGGLHANVKVNQRVGEIPEVEHVTVFPNMGDGGLAVGSAYLECARVNAVLPRPLPHVYLGPAFTDTEMESALRDAGLSFRRPADLADEAAAALQQERIVARFDGRMEYGPRALGNRSILCSATRPEVNTWLNHRLRRTEFMPFAPVVRESDAAAFLVRFDARTANAAEFMTITFDVTDRCRQEAPAIVHVDRTARPQVLRREANPEYHAILDAYHRRTGLSVLVNTSFNLHEEPIVCTPHEAIAAYIASELDDLILGPFMARR